MIILLILLILTFAVFMGWIISSKYIKRDSFFKSLVSFCDTSSNEINFLHTKLLELIDKESNRGDFSDFLNLFKTFLQTSQKKEEFKENVSKRFSYLKREEVESLCNFFCSVGGKDIESELANIKNYKVQFVDIQKEEKKKYAGLYFKLSILMGVVVSILII